MIQYTQDEAKCCICAEIEEGKFPNQYRQAYPVLNRFCYRSNDFVVFPSISPLTLGHLLIFPVRHVSNLRIMPSSLIPEFLQIVGTFSRRLQAHFAPPYIFEHGICRNEGQACGINHAHLHLVPLPNHVMENVNSTVCRDFPQDCEGNLATILTTAPMRPYLMFGSDPAYMFVSHNADVQSQYMRTVIAGRLGIADWNWNCLTRREEFMKTLECLCIR